MYIDVLLKWNARVNLTSVRRPEDIVTRHFGESFFAASHLLALGETRSAIDVGSGSGFPGIPFAMTALAARVTLIESNSKKAAFLNEVIRTLQLGNVNVFNGRAEDYQSRADLVTLRAVEKFSFSMPIASNLVGAGGRLALMIGKSQVARAQELTSQFSWSDPLAIPGGNSRVLLVGTNLNK